MLRTRANPARRGTSTFLGEIPTIPNLITSVRLLAAMAIAWLAVPGSSLSWIAHETNVVVFWLALGGSATDRLDGWLARRYDWTTDLGKRLDQVTDYVLGAAMIWAVGLIQGPTWYNLIIACVILGCALGVGILRFLRLTSESSRVAKHVAGWQMGAGCGILGSYAFHMDQVFVLSYIILGLSILGNCWCFRGYLMEAQAALRSR